MIYLLSIAPTFLNDSRAIPNSRFSVETVDFFNPPDGKVQAGVKRKYVDDNSVLHLKNEISRRSEVQLSLINYRKGGQPFMNLLTMIPIQWDTEEFKYYVGFQVDLVEQPSSLTGRNPGKINKVLILASCLHF